MIMKQKSLFRTMPSFQKRINQNILQDNNNYFQKHPKVCQIVDNAPSENNSSTFLQSPIHFESLLKSIVLLYKVLDLRLFVIISLPWYTMDYSIFSLFHLQWEHFPFAFVIFLCLIKRMIPVDQLHFLLGIFYHNLRIYIHMMPMDLFEMSTILIKTH